MPNKLINSSLLVLGVLNITIGASAIIVGHATGYWIHLPMPIGCGLLGMFAARVTR